MHRKAGAAKRKQQAAHTRASAQPKQMAHCVGTRSSRAARARTGSIYLPAMSTRLLDPLAVQAQLRRLARAPASDAVPFLHAEVARRMAERLAIIRLQPARVIEWWGGLGGGGAVLRAAYPRARRDVVEPDAHWAERSSGAARRAWWQAERWTGPAVRVHEAHAPAAETDAPVQLLWANMVLHAVADPPALIAEWHKALAADGFVMFSCFGPDTLSELRALYRAAGWAPPGIDFVDMHDLGDMLLHAGFADPVMDQEVLTLTWASADALLTELRSLGGNASPLRHAGLRTPRWRDRLRAALDALRGADGRIALRFEIVYGHAFKAAPRIPVQAETTVSLDTMRELVRGGRAPR